jgi:uncharacterized integral membrane protein
MNFKLIFKTLLVIALLALLVVMGMNNRENVKLKMPHVKTQEQPAALMYYAFFGVGFLAGTVLMAGGKKGGSKTSKVQT